MCNSLHYNSQPIPKSGYGWKIFSVRDGVLGSMRDCEDLESTYILSDKKYIVWEKIFEYNLIELQRAINGMDMGFCFFRNFKDARIILKKWTASFPRQKFICLKIKYEEGMGKHREDKIIDYTDVEVALCKKFSLFYPENAKKFKFKKRK